MPGVQVTRRRAQAIHTEGLITRKRSTSSTKDALMSSLGGYLSFRSRVARSCPSGPRAQVSSDPWLDQWTRLQGRANTYKNSSDKQTGHAHVASAKSDNTVAMVQLLMGRVSIRTCRPHGPLTVVHLASTTTAHVSSRPLAPCHYLCVVAHINSPAFRSHTYTHLSYVQKPAIVCTVHYETTEESPDVSTPKCVMRACLPSLTHVVTEPRDIRPEKPCLRIKF